MNVKLIAFVAGAIALSPLAAIAGPGPQDFPRRLTTRQEALDCCKAKGRVALACKDCKTATVAHDEKGVMSWFKPDSTHGCSGCGGKIVVHQNPGGKGGTYAEYQHTCSKCGKNSAYTCTDHKRT